MTNYINLENTEHRHQHIYKFFQKEYKVKYNKKPSGKIKLYVSEKNSIKNIGDLVALYKRELQ